MRTLIAALSLFVGCTTSLMRDADPTGPPGPEESKVIFYRTSLFGSMVAYAVYDGERLLGFTERGNYFEVRCAPGKHVFFSEYPPLAASVVNADLAPGKTYYVKSVPREAPLWSVTGGLAPVTSDSREWNRIEPRIGRMQCRELVPETALEYNAKVSSLGLPVRHSLPEIKILKPEDGK